MKTMTCRKLRGSCDEGFSAATFDEIGEMSRKHAEEMAAKGDKGHITKIEEMKELMNSNPGAAQEWFEKMRKEFEALPEDK